MLWRPVRRSLMVWRCLSRASRVCHDHNDRRPHACMFRSFFFWWRSQHDCHRRGSRSVQVTLNAENSSSKSTLEISCSYFSDGDPNYLTMRSWQDIKVIIEQAIISVFLWRFKARSLSRVGATYLTAELKALNCATQSQNLPNTWMQIAANIWQGLQNRHMRKTCYCSSYHFGGNKTKKARNFQIKTSRIQKIKRGSKMLPVRKPSRLDVCSSFN